MVARRLSRELGGPERDANGCLGYAAGIDEPMEECKRCGLQSTNVEEKNHEKEEKP